MTDSTSLPESMDVQNYSREDKSINLFKAGIKSYLETIMANAGYDFAQRGLMEPTFMRYMLFSLVDSTKQLYSMKQQCNREVSSSEISVLGRMIERCKSMEISLQLQQAINTFNSNLPTYLQNIMLDSGYRATEAEIGNDAFLSFFSNIIVAFTNAYVGHMTNLNNNQEGKEAESRSQYQLQAGENNLDKYRENLSECIKILSNENDLNSSISSMELVANTINHSIYCVLVLGQKFTLKILRSNSHDAKHINHLDNELKVGQSVLHPSFRQSFARTAYKNKQALIQEWAPGYPMHRISEIKRLGIKDFLLVAREIVSSLLAMHSKRIMHLNLKCDHIIFDDKISSIKIIGYGSSASFRAKRSYISSKTLSEIDLRCISPEQTGRMNRGIDYRSDFYSLGILFYKLLTGKYPYDNDNVIELICMHMFQDASPIWTFNPTIPSVLSDMVSRLMNKKAEHRYQSAKGIIHDLDLMITEYDSDPKLASISLAQHDKTDILLIPQKLYGRSKEYSALFSLFARLRPKSFETAFVMGEGGTGKSFLVFELQKAIIQVISLYSIYV